MIVSNEIFEVNLLKSTIEYWLNFRSPIMPALNKLEIDQAPSVSQVFQGLILKGVKHQVELNITGKP